MKNFTWEQIDDGKISPETYILGKLNLLGYKDIKAEWRKEGLLGELWLVFCHPKVMNKIVKTHGRMFSADIKYPSNCISRWKYLNKPDHIVKHIKYWLDMMEYKKFYKQFIKKEKHGKN